MSGLGQSVFNEGVGIGVGIGEARGEARGDVTGMIIAYYDSGVTIEDISRKVSRSAKEVREVLMAKGLVPETV